MTLVKICGITNLDDAIIAAETGVDFIGLNFYEKSKRYITPTAAATLTRELRKYAPDLNIVGVFVHASPIHIRTIATACELDIIQLSGDEPDATIAALSDLKVWKTVRDTTRLLNVATLAQYDGVLFDACVAGEFGGTGQRADWVALTAIRESFPTKFILAGGLTSTNVSEAIKQLNPNIVDTASGVEIESNPRRKDPEKIRTFIAAVRRAT